MQSDEGDSGNFATLGREIANKAQRTFLWVVLVMRDLLNAHNTGATLREFRKIVQGIPPDLNEFYENQLKNTKNENREHMLRLFQLIFYAERSLSPTELRYALAFGCGAYASYDEWSQSSDYIRSDEQMEKRLREHSKGLVEMVSLARSNEAVVQFVHQSVRDFLAADGFSVLRDSIHRTHSAEGHELFKTVCLNYLRVKGIEVMSVYDLRVRDQFDHYGAKLELLNDHPLVEYSIKYIFSHAMQAEKHGVSQDAFRTFICNNVQGFFERWRCLHDIATGFSIWERRRLLTRPIHILAQFGLLTTEIARKERNVDIVGGDYGSTLRAACENGHQDAVRVLLNLGADLTLLTFDSFGLVKQSPLCCTVRRQDLSMLRQLLNYPRSFPTLRTRLQSVIRIRDEKHQLGAVLALLFPEATFPDSAIPDLCEAAGKSVLPVFLFLIDRCDNSILLEDKLWHHVLKYSRQHCKSKIRALLDRGVTVKVTGDVVESLDFNYQAAREVFSLLLGHCEVEVTEGLVDSISCLGHSSQTVRTLEAAGYRFDAAFTPYQLLKALQHGSAENATFFLQRRGDNMSTDEMLDSALSNLLHGDEVTRLVLGYLNPDLINEQTVLVALNNTRCGGDLIRLLHYRWPDLIMTDVALEAAIRMQTPDVVKFVLERCEGDRSTEEILTAGLDAIWHGAEVVEVLLLHDSDMRVRESTVIAAINSYDGVAILEMFGKHGKSFTCTENIVAAAAWYKHHPVILEIILQQDPSAIISSSMIMMAMQAFRGAALISVMLHHD